MQIKLHTPALALSAPIATSALPPVASWENEGGASPDSSATPALDATAVVVPTPLTAAATTVVDARLDSRQREIMTDTSPDGRPPPAWLRLAEWRWFIIGAIIFAAGAITWAALAGLSTGLVIAALVYASFLVIGATPILAAGLLRGQEERAARALALVEYEVVRL